MVSTKIWNDKHMDNNWSVDSFMQYVKRKINSWTYFWVMQRISSVMKIDNMKVKWFFSFFFCSMFRKKLRKKSDPFTRCFLKVNTFLTMWSNCVFFLLSHSFIHFLLMLLFRLRLLQSTARNVHTRKEKYDQINMYIWATF